MTTRLLNSAIMPAPGTYRLEPVTREAFAARVRHAARAGTLVSYIGYEQTAAMISRLAGVSIAVTREATTVESGDELLICRLRYRVADVSTKGRPVDENDFEFFVCGYTALEGEDDERL